MRRSEVLRKVEEIGIVPVVRAPSPELATRAVEALLAGGIPIAEITMTVPGAVELIRTLAIRFRDQVLVGAGTVLDAAQAEACLDAGAEFVVSPGLDLPTIAAVRARDVAMMAGALTPTEVIAAWKAGADMVKIFPCSAMGGARYLRSLRGPLPQVKLLPTGGVTPENAAELIAAGAAALGLGSELVDAAALQAGKDAELTERSRALRATVDSARRNRR